MELTPRVYEELRGMAAGHVRREGSGKTLQGTAKRGKAAAALLKISPQSVMRDWKLARAWLMAELAR